MFLFGFGLSYTRYENGDISDNDSSRAVMQTIRLELIETKSGFFVKTARRG